MLLGGVVLFDTLRIGIGWGTNGPKSGFFPFWLAVIMIAACGLIIVQTLWRGSRELFVKPGQIGPVLKVFWPAAAMVILTHFIGLYVASVLYVGFYMRWVGRHSWFSVVALSIAIPLSAFWVFELWFLVPMPKGPLEAWLGY